MENITFEWDGSHPATNFVNTLDERLSSTPVERLSSYEALVEFVHQAGLINDETTRRLSKHANTSAAEQVLTAVRQLREALFNVLDKAIAHQLPRGEDIARVEFAVHQAHLAQQLTLEDSVFGWAFREPNSPQQPLWELTFAAERLLVSENIRRIKKCAAADCGVMFLDDSRAGARRWCSMSACGNRDKVQRFRAGHKKSS